jgi:hypothetical protein
LRISGECSQINPIGALAAASLGVTEIFKRLVPVNPDRGPLHDTLSFSFYTYSDSDWAGPELPTALNIGTLLQVGAGAIGNGIVHLLSQLGLNGRVVIVDRQDFADENLGTCLLIGPSDINQPKATTLANFIPGAVGYKEEVESSIRSRVGIDFDVPGIVVNGLDHIGARRYPPHFSLRNNRAVGLSDRTVPKTPAGHRVNGSRDAGGKGLYALAQYRMVVG